MRNIKTLIAIALISTLMTGAALMAQNSPATDPGGQNLDVNAILQALGLGGTLLGTNTTGTGTTGTTGITGVTTTQPSGEGSQPPSIIENQFTTTSTPALQARNPGSWTRYAIGVQTGENTITGSDGPPPTWVDGLTTDISNIVLNTWSDIFTGINTFLGVLSGGGVNPDGGGTSTIPNAATTGQGDTTPIARILGQ